MSNVPPGIAKAVRATQSLGKLSRDIGDVALEVAWAAKPEERMALAQRLRTLADKVENAQ